MEPIPFSEEACKVSQRYVELLPLQGWRLATLEQACQEVSLHLARHEVLFPHGLESAYRFWQDQCLQQALDQHPWEQLEPLRVRDRIGTLLCAWMMVMDPHKRSVRVALAALRHQPVFFSRMMWDASHRVWCAAGDQSVDMNFYSKRLLMMVLERGCFKDWLNQHPTQQSVLEEQVAERIDAILKTFHTLKQWGQNPVQRFFTLVRGRPRV